MRSSNETDVGPTKEQLPEAPPDFWSNFIATVADLAEGEYCFPTPFDLAASGALALNDDTGDTAEGLFAATIRRTPRRFHIRISELPPQAEVDERELIDCEVLGVNAAVALLRTFVQELIERKHQEWQGA